ncbi:MAG: ChaN family lipoprotein [Saprospiraceae bacterium]|nr:ChaN family lipoprotein [Saprospiraceae bacterium]
MKPYLVFMSGDFRKILISIGLLAIGCNLLGAQEHEAFRLYNAQGKKTSFKKLYRSIDRSEVVFFGEAHDLSVCHWLELELLKYMNENGTVVLGMEMFESNEQSQLDHLSSGAIALSTLEQHVDLWSNFETDYQPLIEYALQHDIRIIGTNTPDHLPRRVFREGFEFLDSLSQEEKAFLPPLPIPYDSSLPGYQAMLAMEHGDMNSENFPKAQAIRDATMAYFILKNLGSTPLLHVNGSYHSNDNEGICWYVQKHRPDTKITTISTVTQPKVSRLNKDHLGKADFIICVPESMTRTYTTSF